MFLFFTIQLITIRQDKKYKTQENTAQAHISLFSQIEQWKKSREGVDARGKKWICIFKAKDRKQYQRNGTENLFVVIMYLIEAFKMRLLSITESLESPKRSNSTFKSLGKFSKDELMLEMSMKRDLRAFLKLRQRRKKMFIVFNLQTAVT